MKKMALGAEKTSEAFALTKKKHFIVSGGTGDRIKQKNDPLVNISYPIFFVTREPLPAIFMFLIRGSA